MPVSIVVFRRTYDSIGELSLVGDFIAQRAPEFGPAVREIEITLHFPHSGRARPTLEEALENHNQLRATLPTVAFQRSKARVRIHVASDLLDDSHKRSRELTLPLFRGGVREVVDALALFDKQLKRSDDFDRDGFLQHCREAVHRLPTSESQLEQVAAEIRAAQHAKREAMSPWEALGLDWDDYHPDARTILDDPFLWNETDYFAPNGNDTGADVLAAYRGFCQRSNGRQDPVRFAEALARQWGWDSVDTMDDACRRELWIGLAFAQIKLAAQCDAQLRTHALYSATEQRFEAEAADGWEHRGERLRALDIIERVLTSLD